MSSLCEFYPAAITLSMTINLPAKWAEDAHQIKYWKQMKMKNTPHSQLSTVVHFLLLFRQDEWNEWAVNEYIRMKMSRQWQRDKYMNIPLNEILEHKLYGPINVDDDCTETINGGIAFLA